MSLSISGGGSALARRPLAVALCFALLAPTLGSLGCSAADSALPVADENVADDSAELRTGFDGATVFRGVMLGQGPVASRLPALWGDPEHPAVVRDRAQLDPRLLADRVAELRTTLCEGGCPDDTLHGFDQAIERLRRGERDRLAQSAAEGTARAEGPASEAVAHALLTVIEREQPGFLAQFGRTMQSGNPVLVREGLHEAVRVTTAAADTVDRIARGELAIDGIDLPNLNPYAELDGPVVLVVVVAVAVLLVVVAKPGPDGVLSQDILVRDVATQLSRRAR